MNGLTPGAFSMFTQKHLTQFVTGAIEMFREDLVIQKRRSIPLVCFVGTPEEGYQIRASVTGIVPTNSDVPAALTQAGIDYRAGNRERNHPLVFLYFAEHLLCTIQKETVEDGIYISTQQAEMVVACRAMSMYGASEWRYTPSERDRKGILAVPEPDEWISKPSVTSLAACFWNGYFAEAVCSPIKYEVPIRLQGRKRDR
jgi:hypothetical protein